MTNQELQQRLDEIRKKLQIFDTIVHQDIETGEATLNERQIECVQKLFKLFEELDWQVNFNEYKELKYIESDPIDQRKCGLPVKIRSCKKEHGDKTFFGIYIGRIPLAISHSIEDGIVTAQKTRYNPAIFVPELNEIVYGCESWWGEIESEEELNKLIADDVINNVWYVKLLNSLSKQKD